VDEAVGYSTDYTPHEDYEEQGLLCRWEHCIENMPLPASQHSPLSCPVFGHCCPGGVLEVASCDKSIGDVPEKRFVVLTAEEFLRDVLGILGDE